MELRYPVSLNPQAMIYGLAFVEAGNCEIGTKNWSPFQVYRSAGVGVRVFLPMFGLLGLDWGYGFDEVLKIPGANGSNWAFTIGQQFGN
jgi:outer membrane protein insertion porin family